jgi:hypothetical protein
LNLVASRHIAGQIGAFDFPSEKMKWKGGINFLTRDLFKLVVLCLPPPLLYQAKKFPYSTSDVGLEKL